jgi:hypothetical protein
VPDTSARASESESGPTHWQSWSRSRRGIDVIRHHGDRDLDSTRDTGGTDGHGHGHGHVTARRFKLQSTVTSILPGRAAPGPRLTRKLERQRLQSDRGQWPESDSMT